VPTGMSCGNGNVLCQSLFRIVLDKTIYLTFKWRKREEIKKERKKERKCLKNENKEEARINK
jgi:hypothetical protein